MFAYLVIGIADSLAMGEIPLSANSGTGGVVMVAISGTSGVGVNSGTGGSGCRV